jgi:hypothetical protein
LTPPRLLRHEARRGAIARLAGCGTDAVHEVRAAILHRSTEVPATSLTTTLTSCH